MAAAEANAALDSAEGLDLHAVDALDSAGLVLLSAQAERRRAWPGCVPPTV